MNCLSNPRGQFVPISAMVMFTAVIFMLAMVNVYKISRAKLKVQNLADAAALNLASQQAQAYNVVVDRNEWMNHMINGAPSPSDPQAPANFRDCSIFNAANAPLIPGISCAENTGRTGRVSDIPTSDRAFKRHIFNSEDGVKNYAALIATLNEAQFLFVQAYNNFLGAGGGASSASSTNAPTSFVGLMENDIPELKDPSIHLMAWNSNRGEPTLEQAHANAHGANSTQNPMITHMEPLKFMVHHDIQA